TVASAPATYFRLRRAAGTGRWVHVYSRTPVSVEADESGIRVTQKTGTITVQLEPDRVLIHPAAGAPVELAGYRERAPSPLAELPEPIVLAVPLVDPARGIQATGPNASVTRLGARHYRRSEEPYDAADFSAQVAIVAQGSELTFGIDVAEPELVVRRPDAPD